MNTSTYGSTVPSRWNLSLIASYRKYNEVSPRSPMMLGVMIRNGWLDTAMTTGSESKLNSVFVPNKAKATIAKNVNLNGNGSNVNRPKLIPPRPSWVVVYAVAYVSSARPSVLA